MLTVADAIAVAVPSRVTLPSAARWSRHAATFRGVTAEAQSWPSPAVSQSAKRFRCLTIFPGHLAGLYAPHGQIELPLRPRGQAVVRLGWAASISRVIGWDSRAGRI